MLFPSQLLKEWMGSYFPNFLKTGVVIPHQNFKVNEPMEFIKPIFFDATKFNLLHSGNLMKPRSPKGLLEGFELFLKKYPEAKQHARLMLIGSASYHESLLNTYQNKIPEVFVKTTNLPFAIIYELQKKVSVNIILESKSEISPFLPGKFPHCITANKPILLLAPYYSETRRLLKDSYPYMAEVDATKEIGDSIEQLYKQWLISPNKLVLNRLDLENYVSVNYLKEIFLNLRN